MHITTENHFSQRTIFMNESCELEKILDRMMEAFDKSEAMLLSLLNLLNELENSEIRQIGDYRE